MATQEVIDGLTQTIQDCLEAKLQAGFDAQAALTVDIAREVAGAVENKANEYTDIEISKVMTLITGGEVDLGPFTEFMNTIKTLLDGDETTEGYQVFNTLISDTAANKQLLISHTTTIQSIQNTLTTFQSTLADHETRIAALEAAQHEPMECEDCHDEILNLVKGSMAAACAAADVTTGAHYTAEHSSVLAAFSQEIDPVSVTIVAAYDEVALTVAFSGAFTGRKVKSVSVVVGAGAPVAGVFDTEAKTWSFDGGLTADIDGQVVVVKAIAEDGSELGYQAEVTVADPAAAGSGDTQGTAL